ncbi:MAG: ATP-binding protein [Cellvibrionaceae bacterium]
MLKNKQVLNYQKLHQNGPATIPFSMLGFASFFLMVCFCVITFSVSTNVSADQKIPTNTSEQPIQKEKPKLGKNTVETLINVERLYITDRSTPPEDVKENWEAIQLKDLWSPKDRKEHLEAWYRTTFEFDAVPEVKWGLYIARVSSTVSIWINDIEIGNTTEIFGPEPNAWNHPQLFELPAEFLNAGKNTLHIRLKVIETEMGMLFEPEIGDYSILENKYQRAVFFKITATKVLSIVMTIGVLIMLIFYFYMPLPSSYLWFVAGSVLWIIYSLELFVINVPIPNVFWDWLVSFSVIGSVACYFAAVTRMLGLNRKYIEWVLWILLIVHPLAKLFLSPISFSTLSFYYLVLAAFFTVYISVMLCYRGWKRRRSDGSWMMTAGLVIAAMVFYDAFMFVFQITANFAKYPYIPLVSTLLGAGIFFARIVSTYNENENLKVNVQTIDTAIISERERLLREIHDGVGGQLVSTLAILAKGNFKNQDIMDSVKTSLDDLRLIISSLEPASHQGDVLGILATVRERLEHRLLQAGIKLRWKVQDIPVVEGFDSEHALHLMRILQEAITNVVKHANATEIVLSCEPLVHEGKSGITIQLTDNGVGSASQNSSSGYGIKNMQRRIAFLQGTLSFYQKQAGSTVSLWLPLVQIENQSVSLKVS